MLPVARSGSSTAYHSTMAEIATWANTNLPVASTSVSGTVKVDGTSITIASGVISAGTAPPASTAPPLMDGTAAAGAAKAWSPGDHVHPSDTSRVKLGGDTMTGALTLSGNAASALQAVPLQQVPVASSTTPAMDGTATIGSGTTWARSDHIHPTDTSRAALASPTFTGTPAAPTATAGTNTTQLATTAFVQAQMVASGAGVSTWNTRAGAVVLQQSDITAVGALHDVGRNLLHNPLFNVAQRGAGPFTLSQYTVDRWNGGYAGSDTASYTQQSLADADRAAIGDEAAAYSLQNVFVGSAVAGSYQSLHQPIEGVRRLSGKTVIVSFWAKAASGTPRIGINILQNFGTGGSPSGALWVLATGIAVTISTAWTRYSATIAIPSSTGKTLGTNRDDVHDINFWFSSSAGTNALAGNIGVQSGTVQLWGVQLEIGSVATPLEKPDLRYDLANCQRFYQVISGWGGAGYGTAGTVIQSQISFYGMRVIPSATPTWGTNTNLPASLGLSAGLTLLTASDTMTGTGQWGFNATQVLLSADL